MTDRSKLVRCIVVEAALEKLAFSAHRDRTESTASRTYNAAPALDSPVTITPADVVAHRRRPSKIRPAAQPRAWAAAREP